MKGEVRLLLNKSMTIFIAETERRVKGSIVDLYAVTMPSISSHATLT
jgi:hypothetical protein